MSQFLIESHMFWSLGLSYVIFNVKDWQTSRPTWQIWKRKTNRTKPINKLQQPLGKQVDSSNKTALSVRITKTDGRIKWSPQIGMVNWTHGLCSVLSVSQSCPTSSRDSAASLSLFFPIRLKLEIIWNIVVGWKLEEKFYVLVQPSSGRKGYQEFSTWIHQGEILLDQSSGLLQNHNGWVDEGREVDAAWRVLAKRFTLSPITSS